MHPRILRRVIKRHRRLPGLGLDVPHASSYVLSRDALLEICDESELGHARKTLSRAVILLVRHADDDDADGELEGRAARAWRNIFHATIHHELETRALTAAALRARIHRIGQTEFDEIRFVLRQDDRLLPPHDDVATYAEFAATYLELQRFAPELMERTFPSLSDLGTIDATLALDLDAAALLARCRPASAPTLDDLARGHEAAAESGRDSIGLPRRFAVARAGGERFTSPSLFGAPSPSLARAPSTDARGLHTDDDVVRALLERLARALRWRGAAEDDWADAFLPLVRQAAGASARAPWNIEARVLLDVEKACIDSEREISTVDVVGWARSFGKKAVRRPLPTLRDVRIVKHLRAAHAKIPRTSVPEPSRSHLAHVLRDCVERAEMNLRAALRPQIESALVAVGLVPQSVPERVAAKKLVDELIDHIVLRGFLSLGQLRDAISRSHLKLEDLSGPRELARGDAVLELDDRLATALDGVYRRGEIYLRLLQRGSSIAFGTPAGRFLTRYAVLPVGTAFVGLEGAQHIVGPFTELVLHREEPILFTPTSFAVASVVVFALLHSALARRVALAALRFVGDVLSAVLFRAPRWIFTRPIVRAIARSAPMLFASRYLLKPLVLTALLWGLARLVHVRLDPRLVPIAGVAAFVAWNVALNTKIGARIEEAVTDSVVSQWRALRRHVLPGLWALIGDVFRSLIEQVERAIYAVDAFLLFRRGDKRVAVALKGVVGVVWFFASYLVRVYVNLLIEPQVNPIKHFPVVTVAAKIMLPMAPTLIRGMRHALARIFGRVVARTMSAPTVFLLPGFFGFLVWELKENWKLYRANRKPLLSPVSIGHHGETMAALLKPGFHSGTIPKTYAKLRRATWKGKRSALAHRESLHHIEEAIRRFVERELITLLEESPRWTAHVDVRHIEIASNRVRIELSCPALSNECAKIAFEEQSGWLIGGIAQSGFIDKLSDEQRIVLENGLAGFYKLAAVDLVREQIAACLGTARARRAAYDVSEEGLVVWPGDDYETEIVYRLDQHLERRALLVPKTRGVARSEREAARPIEASRIFFAHEEIAWAAWVASWGELAEGKTRRLLASAPLLPPRDARDE